MLSFFYWRLAVRYVYWERRRRRGLSVVLCIWVFGILRILFFLEMVFFGVRTLWVNFAWGGWSGLSFCFFNVSLGFWVIFELESIRWILFFGIVVFSVVFFFYFEFRGRVFVLSYVGKEVCRNRRGRGVRYVFFVRVRFFGAIASFYKFLGWFVIFEDG